MLIKSLACPEYDGANALHISAVFAEFLVSGSSWKLVMMCRQNNLQYWTFNQFKALHDALPEDYRSKLKLFCEFYLKWFRELPVKAERKTLNVGGRAVVMLETRKAGEQAKKLYKIITTTRLKAPPDDSRNAQFYLEKQLEYLKPL